MNVPARYSANATRNSSSVFITIGPCQATGSPIGRPAINRNRRDAVPGLHHNSLPVTEKKKMPGSDKGFLCFIEKPFPFEHVGETGVTRSDRMIERPCAREW